MLPLSNDLLDTIETYSLEKDPSSLFDHQCSLSLWLPVRQAEQLLLKEDEWDTREPTSEKRDWKMILMMLIYADGRGVGFELR